VTNNRNNLEEKQENFPTKQPKKSCVNNSKRRKYIEDEKYISHASIEICLGIEWKMFSNRNPQSKSIHDRNEPIEKECEYHNQNLVRRVRDRVCTIPAGRLRPMTSGVDIVSVSVYALEVEEEPITMPVISERIIRSTEIATTKVK